MSKVRNVYVGFAIGLIIGAALLYSVTAAQPGRMTTKTIVEITDVTVTNSDSQASVCGESTSSSIVAGQMNYPSDLITFVDAGMDQAKVNLTSAEIQTLYDQLTLPEYFANATGFLFSFQYLKNPYMNADMYGGNPNASIWTYPTQIEIGSQDGLLFVYGQILDDYGSPYGNATARGSSILTLFTRVGNWSYGYGISSNMLPGTFNQDLAITDDSYVTTLDGWNLYGFITQYSANQTYYVGPATLNDPYGTGPYNAPQTLNNTGYYFGASVILGTFSQPVMTRYLYAINMSELPTQPATDSCLNVGMMFDLSTALPFAIPSSSGIPGSSGPETFLGQVDNFPTHSSAGPLDPSSYLQVEVPVPDSS